jgi:hypothetical protein
MNVSTSTSSTTTAASSETAQTALKAPEKETDQSFANELNTPDKANKTDNTDKKEMAGKVETTVREETFNAGAYELRDDTGRDLSAFIAMHVKAVDVNDFKYGAFQQDIQATLDELASTRDVMMPSKFDYSAIKTNDEDACFQNTIKMNDEDALFFNDLVQSTDKTTNALAAEIQRALDSGVEEISQPAKVSATLMSAITEAVKTNQPVRIDFDKDVSVILKVNRDGTISANFIPGDKAAEQWLRNNIAFLKQRFDEQDIPYKELSHGNRQKQQQERKNKQGE